MCHFLTQSEVKPNVTCPCMYSRPLHQLHEIILNFDWFTRLCVFFLIGQIDNFGFGFTTPHSE